MLIHVNRMSIKIINLSATKSIKRVTQQHCLQQSDTRKTIQDSAAFACAADIRTSMALRHCSAVAPAVAWVCTDGMVVCYTQMSNLVKCC